MPMSLSTAESPLLAAAARGAHVTDFGALPPSGDRGPRSLKGEFVTSTVNLRRVITKLLVSTAIAVGAAMGGAALASADANSTGVDQNAFSTLSCSCRETTPAG